MQVQQVYRLNPFAGAMATYWSEDLFLEKVHLVVLFLFLHDGCVRIYDDYDPHGRRHEGGDILELEREWEDEKKTCVVLGFSEDSPDEAILQARTYVERVAKWHGQEGQQLIVFGHDLAGSEVLYHDDV
ncbi:Argininosuccinate synthase [Frankliniella fusca]|uniref:Argininosuccinate synthase n=1 Tax=Frankliniella fusca TaxID=407009 RepID=A0AAE1LKE9_9NEOP|nr:Argininosuccinate synthase [Frankliniella fusca]